MAGKNRIDANPDDLQNLSKEELQQRIQEEKKNARRSLRFAFTALIAIIFLCIAWFVHNTQVTGTGSKVSADSNNAFELASVGVRQDAEKTYYVTSESTPILLAGTEKKYSSYIDAETGEEKQTEQTYHIGSSGLAWYLNGQESFMPGAGGKLEFYIIPRLEGLSSVTVTLNMQGYQKDTNSSTSKTTISPVTDQKLQSLLSGHILFFQHLDDTYGYRGWLGLAAASNQKDGENQSFTVTAPANGNNGSSTFKKGTPYKITLYWKWPQYFRNYVYTQRSTQGDLFTDKINQGAGSEYQKFIDFLNTQKSVTEESNATTYGKLFYNKDNNGAAERINGTINNQMSDEVLNQCNTYYNQADEYIGKNIQYVYVEIDVD